MLHSPTVLWFAVPFVTGLCYRCLAATTNSCVMDSPSLKHEQKTFQDLVKKGSTVIITNLALNHSENEVYHQNNKSQRWLWIAKNYRFLLSYPYDVDVYSFGLLNVTKNFLDINISIRNISKACELNLNIYLAQYLTKVAQFNKTGTDNVFKEPQGEFCYSKIEINRIRDFITNISGVKIGLPFHCYPDNKNSFQVVEKSYLNYIIISIVLLVYAFYQLAIEMALFVEDKKIDDGCYYTSDSPLGALITFKKFLFSGNNKYFALMRIILLISIFTLLVYFLKSKIYDSCNCSLELSTTFDWNIFPHAENFYKDNWVAFILGIIYFVLVHGCVFSNSSGNMDDFILLDCLYLKTISVSEFRPRNKSHLMSYKLKKVYLIFSFQFWSQIFCFNHPACKKNDVLWMIKSVFQFLVNAALILCSTFCPVMFTVCIGFIKVGDKCVSRCRYKHLKLPYRWVFFISAIEYLIVTHVYSFNFFFNGISYLIQFLIFTLCLAVPRLPLESFIYVVFITSFILYIYRFLSQFQNLYKSLLETILSVQDQNEIQIKVFNKIVEKYFPIEYEVIYLFVKILFCSLFFVIIFDTMQKNDYTKIKAQPDLATVVSVIFLFGPPRVVEALFATDFTSRVHMKEKEIKIYIETLNSKENKRAHSESNVNFYDCDCGTFPSSRCFKILQYICTCLCGCCKRSVDEDEDNCECCTLIRLQSTDSTSKKSGEIEQRTLCGCCKRSADDEEDKCECCNPLHSKCKDSASDNFGETELKTIVQSDNLENDEPEETPERFDLNATQTYFTVVRIPSLWLPNKIKCNENALVGSNEKTPEETYKSTESMETRL